MRGFSCVGVVAAVLAITGCTQASDDDGHGASRVNGDVTADSNGGHTVNGSVEVPSGQKTGDVGTVNGSIRVGENATLRNASAVNGSIRLGGHATATLLDAVNGAISLDDGAHISDAVTTVNGSVTLHDGSEVAGSLVNVNGAIHLHDAHVGKGIETVSGSIDILGTSRVEGGIHVKKPTSSWILGWLQSDRVPRIVIGPGAVVQGDLRFERKVKLYVSDKATIGAVTGATPEPFTGDQPPG
jgi:DUF4097 and DUF4098 domain-containing protein YvlB